MKLVPPARGLIGNAYSEAGEKAFAKDPDTGTYIYESKFKKNAEEEDRFFGRVDGVRQHPFLAPAISVSTILHFGKTCCCLHIATI